MRREPWPGPSCGGPEISDRSPAGEERQEPEEKAPFNRSMAVPTFAAHFTASMRRLGMCEHVEAAALGQGAQVAKQRMGGSRFVTV